MTDTDERLSRLEEVVSGLTQVPDDAFEDSEGETYERSVSSSTEEVESEAEEEAETCQEVKSDGEVCGRERPCPYHDEE